MTKKEKTLLMVLSFVLVIGGVVIWWTFAPSEKETSGVSAPVALEKKDKLMQNLPEVLDFSIFDHPWFEKAKVHGKLPVEAGVTGRDNPFKPY